MPALKPTPRLLSEAVLRLPRRDALEYATLSDALPQGQLLFSKKDLSLALSISPRAVESLWTSGALPYQKLNGSTSTRYTNRADLIEFVLKRGQTR